MSVNTTVEYASCDDLFLDPLNPRLGRSWNGYNRNQDELLEQMRDWDLEEIALSYLSGGGFWVQEALIVVEEEYLGNAKKIVVEGNRRLAALRYLKRAVAGNFAGLSQRWQEFVAEFEIPQNLFDNVPYLLASSRSDVVAFLGFRHVSGIKQWDAEEKAGFIAQLIDEGELSFLDVARRIGSNMPAVKRHYIAFKVLQQIERDVEFVNDELTSRRFALLYMSLNTSGAKSYLGIQHCYEAIGKIDSDVVDSPYEDKLVNFARWVFGEREQDPLVRNTNVVTQFSKMLETPEAVEYLESSKRPIFEVAARLSGGVQEELERYLTEASYNIGMALSSIHRMKNDEKIVLAFESLKSDFEQLSSIMEG